MKRVFLGCALLLSILVLRGGLVLAVPGATSHHAGSTAKSQCLYGPGHSRWDVKTSVKSVTTTPVANIPIATFVHLGNLTQYHKNQQYSGYIPDPIVVGGKTLHEGDIVEVDGFLQQVKCESGAGDGDLHGDLAAAASGGDCAIVEVPNPKWIADPQLRADVKAARAKFVGYQTTAPAHVQIVGQLFYDMDHSPTVPERGHGLCAKKLWEIHPVLKVS